MERLESMVPVGLKRAIYESTTEDLISTCSALHESFLRIPEFRTILGELNDPEMGLCRKSSAEALKLKNKGNQFFVNGDYEKALSFYSQALRFAPMSANDTDKDLVAVLYVNRASSFHNLGLLEECIHDCNRAVVLSHQYAKAWYRRGKANASLGNYRDAINDMEIALSMEGSLSGKKRIKDELEDALNYSKSTHGTSRPSKHSYEKNLGCVEPQGVQLGCVSTPDKGRGMASCNNIQSASLVHREEPYAASCSSLDFPFSGSSIAQLVVLISQIKINSMAIVHMISVDAHGALKSEKHSVSGNSLTCILEQIGQLDLQQRQQMLKDQYAFNCQCNACSELNLSDLAIHAFCCVTTNCPGVILETQKVNQGRLASSFLQDYVAPCIWELPMPACEEKKNAIREVAQLLLKRPTDMPPLQTGHCLYCGSYRDLESSNTTAKETTESIKRLQDFLTSNQMSSQVISTGLKSLSLLRSVRHAYSKDVAQAEDIISEALCTFGEFQQAVDHCKASVEVAFTACVHDVKRRSRCGVGLCERRERLERKHRGGVRGPGPRQHDVLSREELRRACETFRLFKTHFGEDVAPPHPD
ncbi:hypothetical protein QJS10_CPA09g01645 [Acorus calamus]|uniref:Uncharacterized protein n=1 Tax=Acorus calamus TaxID=4465 RepID=A0AAV9E5R0_ACOCL|nr:hypothetical protein QJS10_CPA09g01645 [Acorus calamus]